MWKKSLGHYVNIFACDSDRECCIELVNVINGQSIFIINVYLPQRGCKIADYQTEIHILNELLCRCKSSGEVIVIGDMNAHFGQEYGPRFWGDTTANARHLVQCIDNNNLYMLDATVEGCKGPCYTFHVENVGTSYVDHCLITKPLVGIGV